MKHQQDNAIGADDEEYHTYVDRYSKNMEEGLGEIAAGISDPQLRNAFTMENKPRVVAGQEQMRKKAFAVETDVQKSNLNSRLDGLSKSILDTGTDQADKLLSIENAVDQIDAARESGYISSEAAGNLERAFKADTAVKFINALPIEEQKDALNSKLAKDNIPADVHAKMLRALKPKTLRMEAQKIVAGMDGMTDREKRVEARKHRTSGDLYGYIKQEMEDVRVEEKQLQLQDDQALHNDWYLKVVRMEEGYTLKDLQSTENAEFIGIKNTKFQKDLLNAARAVAKAATNPRTQSDPQVLDTLHSLNSEEDYESLRNYYLANVGKLSGKHIDTWSKISNEGVIPEEYKSQFTLIQRVENKLAEQEIFDTKKRLLVRNLVDRWYEDEFNDDNPNPNDTKTNAAIDRFIAEAHVSDFGPDTVEPLFALSPEDKEEMYEQTIEDPENATANNLEVVLNDVFQKSDDPEVMKEIVGIGISRYEDLTPATQKKVFNAARVNETELFYGSLDLLRANGSPDPTDLQMIKVMEYVRDFNRRRELNGE
ncbi:hypothetical protein OAO65_02255 [Flavobacteriales bacterium]|nr:hypothetical protein [Flavobacteriales bacterium]